MHEVIQLQAEKGGRARVKVIMDDASAFVLYQKEIDQFGIEAGKALPDDVFHEIVTVLLPKRATARAMHLLEKRPYTERRLREKLAEGSYPHEAVEEAIRYVRSFGYLDDLQYALDYIDYRKERMNRRKLAAELTARGVESALIEEAFARCFAREEGADGSGEAEDPLSYERRLIEKELSKRRFDRESATYEERMKVLGALSRKGFDPSLVQQVMGRE